MIHVVDNNMKPLCGAQNVGWKDKALTLAAAEGMGKHVCPDCRKEYLGLPVRGPK